MILLNDFKRQWEETRLPVCEAVEEVGASGWYILGKEVQEFESALASYWGLTNAIGVASGLDAIEIALRAMGCRSGDRVLTTPLSAFATTLAIVKIGAVPVFVDTDLFGLIDLASCRDVLERRPEIRFAVPVHLFGHSLDLDQLARLKEQFGCNIIEDCAQSIGAKFNGRPTGSVGAVAATSFYPTKNLGALGDGGAILTASEPLSRSVRALRDYGQTAKYRHDVIGYNSRLDELQAAILGKAFLPRLPQWTQRRREIASRYLSEIRNPAVRCLGVPPGSESCWHLFPVAVAPEMKARFQAHLKSRGIMTGEHYPIAIPDQKALAYVRFEIESDCSRARSLAISEVSLPIHPQLSVSEVAQVIEAVNDWKE